MTVRKAASGDDGCEEEEDSAGVHTYVRTVNTVTVI